MSMSSYIPYPQLVGPPIMARVRSQIVPNFPAGQMINSQGTVFQGSVFNLKSATCTDETGINTDHPMTITKYDKSRVPPLDGTYVGSGTYRYQKFQPVGMAFGPAHLNLSPPSAVSSATTALARTNPGRSEVSIPVFVRELKDLPRMLKGIGDLLRVSKRKPPLVRLVSGEYLSWTFGWAPLISDLKKMLNFQALVDKRHKELVRLHQKGGLKRRISTFSDTACSDTSVYLATFGLLITARKSTMTSVKQWATVRWKPTNLPSEPVADLGQQARKAVFGLSLQPEDLWEIIPWSWLIDWFSNVGTFLQAHNNRIPASASAVNVMTRTETQFQFSRTDSYKAVNGGSGTVTLVTKKRDISSGGLSIGEGYLNPHQLSILGALAINRLSKRF